MSEMVERVARVLAGDEVTWSRANKSIRDRLRAEACRIIAAMREPTPAQIAAAIDADDLRTGSQTCAHIWRAMIDAALK